MEQNIIIPTTREAALLKRLEDRFDQPGAPAQIQRTFIRVEKVLTADNVAQVFNLTEGSGQRRPRERFIGKNDLVVIYEMKVGVNKCNNTVGNNSNSVDYTYPDLLVFSAAGEADALEAIFNGTISLKSDTYEALNAYSLNENRVVPRTQFEPGATQASFSGDESGYVPLTQPQIFAGSSAIDLNFSPASSADVAAIGGAAGTSNVFFIQYKVFVIRNAAQALTRDNFDAALRNDILKHGRF